MKLVKAFLFVLIGMAMVFPAISQASDTLLIFRYKPSFETASVDTDHSGDFDVTARFFGLVGEPFSSTVPTKPGATVTNWQISSGSLPDGLEMNPSSGLISGIPSTAVSGRFLPMRGYAPSGEMGTYASVTFDVFEPRPNALKREFYGHTGRPFSHLLRHSGADAVYQWVPLFPLPEGVEIGSGSLGGTVTRAGVWSVALSGRDHNGQEIAFIYGEVRIEDGPSVDFIADRIRIPGQTISVMPRVGRSVGELHWAIEGEALPRNLSFRIRDGRIYGGIPVFDAKALVRLKATDADGTWGYSNWFTVGTRPADVDLRNVGTRNLTVNEAVDQGFSTWELVGERTWSVVQGELPPGLWLDPVAGRLKGSPTHAGDWPGVVVRVDASSSHDQSNPFLIRVHPDRMIGTVPPVHVRVGAAFQTQSPVIKGGVAPYDLRLAEGEVLPGGVSFDAGTGVLSGNLEVAGNNSVSLVATDATGRDSQPFTVGIIGYSGIEAELDQEIYEGVRLLPLSPAIQPVVPDYSVIPVGKWALSGSPLPAGLFLNPDTGGINGTPTVSGLFGPYALTVTDGSGAQATTGQFTVKIEEVPDIVIHVADVEYPRLVDASLLAGRADNAVGAAYWTLDPSSMALPVGVSVAESGLLVGRLMATEPVHGIVLRVTDAEGREAVSAPFSIVPVMPDPVTASPVDFEWAAGFHFSTPEPQVSNVARPLTFSSSALPSWLSLDPGTGSLSGTAMQPGDHGPFILNLTDAMGRTGTVGVSVGIVPDIAIEVPLQNHVSLYGSLGPVRPAADNVIGDMTWLAPVGNVPSWLEFDADTGSLSGKPMAEGTLPLTLRVRDSLGRTGSAATSIVVGPRQPLNVRYSVPTLFEGNPAGMPIFPTKPDNAEGSVAYGVSGTLPMGIYFDVGSGAFMGVPAETGRWTGIRVTGSDDGGSIGDSGPLEFFVTLQGVPQVDRVHVTVPVDRFFETPAAGASELVGTAVYSLVSALAPGNPDGIEVDPVTGSVSGTPRTEGVRTFVLRVVDEHDRSAQFEVVVDVRPEMTLTMPNVVATKHAPLPRQPLLENASGTVAWTLSPQGGLPEGLNFDTGVGKFTGAPVQEGSFGPFTLTAEDGFGSVSVTFSMTVGPRKQIEIGFAKTDNQALANNEYSLTPTVENAVGTVVWELVSGTLPPGLSLNESNGSIGGTPSDLGEWSGIVIRGTDALGGTMGTGTSQAITITVKADGTPIILVPAKLTTKVGYAFTTAVPDVFNTIGDWYLLSPQAIDLGLDFDSSVGTMSGMFDTHGTRVIDLEVTDSTNRVTSEPQVIDVLPNLRVTYPATTYAMVNKNMSAIAPVKEYAIGAVTYELVGTLPVGLSFSQSTGRITGRPTEQVKVEGLVVYAEDSWGDRQASEPFAIDVVDDGSIPEITFNQPSSFWRAGIEIAAVTPTVRNGKTGDVFVLNQPLPAGLLFDTATGRISGTPEPGTQGIHEGYVMHVVDVNGRGTSSEPFDLRIRHKDSTLVSGTTWDFRSGRPFVTPEIAIANPDVLIGDWRFEFSGTQAGIVIDPVTGSISGTLTGGTRSVSVRIVDEIGIERTFSYSLAAVTLAVSFTDQSIEAGSTVSLKPAHVLSSTSPLPAYYVRGAAGPDTRWSITWQNGIAPEGLGFNAETGELSGTMPFGTYFVRISVEDNGSTAHAPSASAWRKLIGTSSAPLNMAFANLVDQEHGSMVESEILPFTGVTASTSFSYSAPTGSGFVAPESRTCYDKDCIYVKADWSVGGKTVANGEFVQIRMRAQYGSEEISTARLGIYNGSTWEWNWEWSVTSAERDDIVSADTVLPQEIHHYQGGTDLIYLYDGRTDKGVNVVYGGNLIYDFGRLVWFDSFYLVGTTDSSYAIVVEIETANGWRIIHQARHIVNGTVNLQSRMTAQKVRLSTNHVSYNLKPTEFRIGSGGPHSIPEIANEAGHIATLTDFPQTVQIDASIAASPYLATNSLAFSVLEGALPQDANLSQDGLLSLPAAQEVGPGNWRFTIRVQENAGIYSDRTYHVFSEGEDASGIIPASVVNGTLPVNSFNLHRESGASLSIATSGIMITYDDFVTFDKIYVRGKSSTGYADILIEMGDSWVVVGRITGVQAQVIPLGSKHTIKRILVDGKNTFYTIMNLMPGAGPFYGVPEITTSALPNLGGAGQQIQLASAYSYAYSEEPLVFSLASGNLPTGSTLTQGGQLTLPAANEAPMGSWAPVIRITDGLGGYSEKAFRIGNPAGSAAQAYPVSVVTGYPTYQGTVADLYDGDSATVIRIAGSSPITFDFGQPVEVSSVLLAKAGSTNQVFYIEAEVGGVFQEMLRFTSNGTQVQTFGTDGLSWTSSRFRISTPSPSTYQLHTMRLGHLGEFPPPLQ